MDEVDPCVIMEYLPAGDLQAQHNTKSLSEVETIVVLYQCLLGLSYLHSQSVTHRDIKPENILFKSRRPLHVKLADFGLASNDPILHTSCGTHLYAAPEVLSGSKYTPAVDIWSLGVIALQYAYGLPEYRKKGWCNKLIRAVEDWDSDDFVDLLSSSMLRLDAKKRKTASECLQQADPCFQKALNLTGGYGADSATPTEVATPAEVMPSPALAGSPAKSVKENGSSDEAQTRVSSVATHLSDQSCVRTQLWDPADSIGGEWAAV